MRKVFLAISNHNDENVCKQINGINKMTKQEITEIISQINPSLCPYTKQVKLDVAIKVRNESQSDSFPRITRTFIYKEESYNNLTIHTVAFPDIMTQHHHVNQYQSYHTKGNALYALCDIIHAFLEGDQPCSDEDLPY